MKKPLLSIKNVIKALVLVLSLACIAIPVSVLVADFQRLQAIQTQQPSRPPEPPLLAQIPIENVPPTSSQDRIQSLAAVPPLEQRLKNKISVEFRKTAIEDALRIMADQVNIDIISIPNLTGEVSVTFTDVPFEEALNVLLSVHGYSYHVTNGIVLVTAFDEPPAGRYAISSSPATSPPQLYTAGAVTAIVNSNNSCAFIEGQIVHKGDTINGIKVVRIEKGKVHFEKDGKKWTQGIEVTQTRQPALPQRPTLAGQIAWESVLREIDRMWDQEYGMIKRWWSIEEDQAKSLPTVWLREYHDRQALENFQQRDRELKGKYSAIEKEVASLSDRVDANFLQQLWRSQEQQLQARANLWQRNRKQELAEIWASYEQQRKYDALPTKSAPPDGSKHKVVNVIDGDTIKVETAEGSLLIRVIGIDAPETVHPLKPIERGGPEASQKARELLEGNTVVIHYDRNHGKWDKYGRLLAYLDLPDGRDFGLLMIQEGLARAYPKYPFSRQQAYLEAQEIAQQNKVGLWGRPSRPL